MKLLSPAKINLFLHVTGKREDGYHTLETLMCAVGLYDTIILEPTGGDMRVTCGRPGIPEDASNLAWKAAALFYRKFGKKGGAHITIDKVIPAGAGLGGGSSNAASILTGLNEHHGRPFSRETLIGMGVSLGADVPFFIDGKPSLASGVGEVLEPFENLDPYSVVVVYPGLHVSTAEVFKKLNFGLTNSKKIFKETSLNNGGTKEPFDTPFDPRHRLWNDLEPVTSLIHPSIDEIKRLLMDKGADGALMSGSGSSVFGLFSDSDGARAAYASLQAAKEAGWELFIGDLIL